MPTPKTSPKAFWLEDLGGSPIESYPAIAHRHYAVGEATGKHQIVEHSDDRHSLVIEPPQEMHHLNLMGNVEEARRLIEEEDLGLLGEGKCDPCSLTFAAREAGHRPGRERFDVGGVHRPVHGFDVDTGDSLKQTLVGKSTTVNELLHGQIGATVRRLGKDGQASGDLL